ncbi:hypothetical protein [Mycolicibacterium sp.]|uniref:hypothetical protein n=1 Tax=Mycolicibacterium sp. TaxID=2320850 RepID=UPI003D101B47
MNHTTLRRIMIFGAAAGMIMTQAGCSIAYLPSEQMAETRKMTLLPNVCSDGRAEGTAVSFSRHTVAADILVRFATVPTPTEASTTVQIPPGQRLEWTVSAPSSVSSSTCDIGLTNVTDISAEGTN